VVFAKVKAALNRRSAARDLSVQGNAPVVSTGTSGLQLAHTYPTVDPYASEPIFAAMRRRKIPPIVLFLIFPLVFVPVMTAAARQGDLTHPQGLHRFSDDLRVLVGADPRISSNYFPLLRDYSSMMTVISATLTVPLVYLNCGYMGELLRQLTTWDSQQTDPGTAKVISRELQRVNTSFAFCGWLSWPALAASAATTLGLYASYLRSDSFQRLMGRPLPRSGGQPEWWASYREGHYASAVTFLIFGSVLLYVFIKNNLLGYCFIRFFIKVRHVDWYGVDPLNEDGYYGWRSLRRLLVSAYTSILLTVIAAISLFMIINIRSSWLASPILLLLLASIPGFVLGPLYLLGRVIERYKSSKCEDIRVRFRTDTAGLSPLSAEYRRLEAEARDDVSIVRNVRPRLFRPTSVIAAVTLYIIPVASFVLSR
jgi:hypothetical protein